MFGAVSTSRKSPHNRQGSPRVVTQKWRDTVERTLKERGLTQRWLEEQIGAPNGSVQKVLRRDATSKLVDDICNVLQITPPLDVPDDVQEILDIYFSKNEKGRERLRKMLRLIDDD